MNPESTDLEKILLSNDENFLLSNNTLEKLSEVISFLLQNDFEKLIYLLYRVDVSENKLKATLKDNPSQTEYVIAKMLIDRQIEKIKFRQNNKNNFNSQSEEELW